MKWFILCTCVVMSCLRCWGGRDNVHHHLGVLLSHFKVALVSVLWRSVWRLREDEARGILQLEASDITWLVRVFHNLTKRKKKSQEQPKVEANSSKSAVKVHFFFVVHLHATLESAFWNSMGSELTSSLGQIFVIRGFSISEFGFVFSKKLFASLFPLALFF